TAKWARLEIIGRLLSGYRPAARVSICARSSLARVSSVSRKRIRSRPRGGSMMPGQQNEDVELKVSYMVKRSQGKSALGATNFKKRVFCLTLSRFSYYDGTVEKRGNLKGYVELTKVKVIEKVMDTAFNKPAFQVVHGDLTLYVIAANDQEQQEWISLIRQNCKNNVLLQEKYHPGLFQNNKWTCCDHRSKHSQGCRDSFTKASSPPPIASGASAAPAYSSRPPRGPLPSIPLPNEPTVPPHQNAVGGGRSSQYSYQHTTPRSTHSPPHQNPIPNPSHHSSQSSHQQRPPAPLPAVPVFNHQLQSHEFDVVAMYSYPGQEQGDLALVKGQKYIVFDDARPHWWRARDERGREGYVPSNYVKKVGQTMEGEEWFFPTLSRTRAEDILKEEAKEGGFVVRNSSRENMYTLSICHEGQVRHYHIKHDDEKYYISDKHRFPTIKELIEYHKLNGGGLVTRLRKPPQQLLPQLNTLSPLFDEAWEISKSELTLGRELGSGQFGRVVAGKWKGKIDVAIKMMKEGAMNEEDFIEEAKVMKNFQHENLVKLYGVCTAQGPVFIIQELMSQGCLLQYIRNRKELAEKNEVMLDMGLQVCSAMTCLEVNGFIHRDLAARNCLIGERNVVKVADFGLARFVVDDEYTASEGTKFPIKWAAPEVITHAKFSSKSDVWSFGKLMGFWFTNQE
ncbi:Tyrosine-protein kinase BTK, partial [Geodia barretti]